MSIMFLNLAFSLHTHPKSGGIPSTYTHDSRSSTLEARPRLHPFTLLNPWSARETGEPGAAEWDKTRNNKHKHASPLPHFLGPQKRRQAGQTPPPCPEPRKRDGRGCGNKDRTRSGRVGGAEIRTGPGAGGSGVRNQDGEPPNDIPTCEIQKPTRKYDTTTPLQFSNVSAFFTFGGSGTQIFDILACRDLGHVPKNGVLGCRRAGHNPQKGVPGCRGAGYNPRKGVPGCRRRTCSPFWKGPKTGKG